MDDEEIKQQNEEIKRRMIWINTNLLVFILFTNINVAVWLFIDKLIYRAASFLIISLITLFIWDKWRSKIGAMLE